MNDSQITVLFAVLAILGTALGMFRQRALPGKALAAVIVSTLIIGGFIFVTLTEAR